MVSEPGHPGGGESQQENPHLLSTWESDTSYDVPFLRSWRSSTSLKVPILGPRASLISHASLASRASHLSAAGFDEGEEDQSFFAEGWTVRLAAECWRWAHQSPSPPHFPLSNIAAPCSLGAHQMFAGT